MPNFNQAPKIKNNGIKDRRGETLTGYTQRSLLLEEKIAQGIDGKHFVAYKVMMFLTGNAEGFSVAQETIMERMNITKSAYYDARKYLVEKGWISITDTEIIVNYDAIYGVKSTAENTSIEMKSTDETTSIKSTAENTSILKGTVQYTPIVKEVGWKSTSEKTSILKSTTENTSLSTAQYTSLSTNDQYHNNIRDNNINNNIIEQSPADVWNF